MVFCLFSFRLKLIQQQWNRGNIKKCIIYYRIIDLIVLLYTLRISKLRTKKKTNRFVFGFSFNCRREIVPGFWIVNCVWSHVTLYEWIDWKETLEFCSDSLSCRLNGGQWTFISETYDCRCCCCILHMRRDA